MQIISFTFILNLIKKFSTEYVYVEYLKRIWRIENSRPGKPEKVRKILYAKTLETL